MRGNNDRITLLSSQDLDLGRRRYSVSALVGGSMSYEPSGDTRLEGQEILKRLAEYLNVHPRDLHKALTGAAWEAHDHSAQEAGAYE